LIIAEALGVEDDGDRVAFEWVRREDIYLGERSIRGHQYIPFREAAVIASRTVAIDHWVYTSQQSGPPP
jgi:hypothetical protein